jgi:hypothetical protein
MTSQLWTVARGGVAEWLAVRLASSLSSEDPSRAERRTLVTLEDSPHHLLVNLCELGGCVDGDPSCGLVLEHDVWLLSVQTDPDRFELNLEQPALFVSFCGVEQDDDLDEEMR